jgi:hypothetical protein
MCLTLITRIFYHQEDIKQSHVEVARLGNNLAKAFFYSEV